MSSPQQEKIGRRYSVTIAVNASGAPKEARETAFRLAEAIAELLPEYGIGSRTPAEG